MSKTFFLGDHRQMFPHINEKIILTTKSMSLDKIRDNIALLNGVDLTPVLENMNIKKVGLTEIENPRK